MALLGPRAIVSFASLSAHKRTLRTCSAPIPLAPKNEFLKPAQADATCPALRTKINPFAFCPNQIHKPRRPALFNRGAFRDRHERWARDAVDALRATDERIAKADGEVVWS
jgi:hypothetical protein